MTWQDILTAIREGKSQIPVAQNGAPLVAINAPIYEMMELLEALTTGYNGLVCRSTRDQARIECIRKLAQGHFPAERKAASDGWISVEDWLPMDSGYYMTYSDLIGVYPYHYSAAEKKFNSRDGDGGVDAIDVQFWFPTPMPPARKEG